MKYSLRSLTTVCGALVLVGYCCTATRPAPAIETTYGEDPVPNTRYNSGEMKLGYGVDPIPVKTLRERMFDWHNNIPDNSVTVQTYPPVRPRPKNFQPNRFQVRPFDLPARSSVPTRAGAKPSSRRTAQQNASAQPAR